MPHVIRYNDRDPQKHAMFPKCDYFRADKDYADIARFMGWGTDKQSDAELVNWLKFWHKKFTNWVLPLVLT